MVLQHDIARPHTSAATLAAIESIEFEVVPQPAYSLDLAPPDFCLFATLKEHLKQINFACNEEVHTATG